MEDRKTVPLKKRFRQLGRSFQWLTPGLGVKRWIFLLLASMTLLAIGLGMLFLHFYRISPGSAWLPWFSALSLRFLERPLRVLIFGGAGAALFAYALWGLNRALLQPFLTPGKNVLDTVSAYRRRERGPRIAAIGGGTGLSTLLRGLKTHTRNLTAIVTTADDGGSSGELRRSLGVIPPGDIRSCLAALSSDETLMTQIFQYRFASGAGLEGHTLGNLFITALSDITGSFEEAVAESGRVLAVSGRVLPATLHDVRLEAAVELPAREGEVRVRGESSIPRAEGRIKRLWLNPENPPAFPPTIQALLSADLIVVGPGSLYTSILPNLLVPDIAAALKASRAIKFYVCNVTTQVGETDGFSCDDHVHTLERYLDGNPFDVIICNSGLGSTLPDQVSWVTASPELANECTVYESDLRDPTRPNHHDPARLAQVVMDLFYDRTGPLV